MEQRPPCEANSDARKALSAERLCHTVICPGGDLTRSVETLTMDTVYRRRARQCRARAQLRATQDARANIANLAATWLRLAERVERKQQQSQPEKG
jgi:hypothetical protein